mmetsp:Transcript_9534/g.17978  ORF Transcript_9534/g.17978 Transcript_9534/m.17978 type:complete len:503 (+) Transcript_9534:163-1671(+)
MCSKRVAIIGGGSAGSAACKCMLEQGLDAVVFEAGGEVGGVWSNGHDRPTWEGMFTNTSRRMSEFSDFCWEDNVPAQNSLNGVYPERKEVLKYIQSYAEFFNLNKHFVFHAEVNHVVKSGDGWLVKYSVNGGKDVEERFDFVIVASGRYKIPHKPLCKELETFNGMVMHSSQVRQLGDVKGKRILVVGNSISGSELCSSLCELGAVVSHSFRRPRYIANKFSTLGNRPMDEVLFNRIAVWLGRYIPGWLDKKILKSILYQHFPSQLSARCTRECMVPNPDIGVAGITACYNYVELVKKSSLQLFPGVRSCEGSTVYFADGTSGDFDIIIQATGYELNLPFLDKNLLETVTFERSDASFLRVYKETFIPGDHTIAFIGHSLLVGPTFPVVEMQSRWASLVFSKQLGLPDPETMEASIENCIMERFSSNLDRYVLCTRITEGIADELGISPSVLDALCDPKRLLIGPLFPCQYRLSTKWGTSEQVVQNAKERLARYTNSPVCGL